MATSPIITFKAGMCDVDTSSKPYKIKAQSRPGYIYLYSEDDLVHFCWRERSVPSDEPELDLVMVPTDGHFVPYEHQTVGQESAKTNGRIFVLKFSSSSQRHLFWLQSKPQARSGDPAWLSPRDRKIGEVVDKLLQGDEVDVGRELARARNSSNDDGPDDDNDEAMEDVVGHGGRNDPPEGGAGGAGHGATGGDVREEGENSREGGADGARAVSSAVPDAATAVRNFLESLQSGAGGQQQQQQQQQAEGKLYPLLNDLLETPTTIPMIDTAGRDFVDNLLTLLPPTVLVLAQQGDSAGELRAEPTAEALEAARQAMSLDQKKSLLKKVLRSPQFHQSLASLTMALRDGGLPTIAEALGVRVENGGLMRGGSMPLGGGDAVEAFVEGVKKSVQEKR